jgi:flagellar protein FliS
MIMLPNRKAINQYTTAMAETTDQGRLIVICYDVAITSLEQAKELLAQNDIPRKAKKIYKAQDAISELMCSLSFDKGGVIAKNLYRLYEYFNWRLSEANIKKNSPMLDEVLRHLRSLREAWLVAIENVRPTGSAAPASPDRREMTEGKPRLSLVG